MLKSLYVKISRLICKHLYGNEYVAMHQNIDFARNAGVTVGDQCRFFSTHFSSEPYLIKIGNHVTITDNVQFITHDGGVWVFRENEPTIDFFGKIILGNNIFIGLNSIILFNTNIGDNSIVAAGSIVKGVFPPGSVIAGVPARRIASITEYYEKNKSAFTYVRDLDGPAKRRSVIEFLNNKEE